jgi:hypothetical protein
MTPTEARLRKGQQAFLKRKLRHEPDEVDIELKKLMAEPLSILNHLTKIVETKTLAEWMALGMARQAATGDSALINEILSRIRKEHIK